MGLLSSIPQARSSSEICIKLNCLFHIYLNHHCRYVCSEQVCSILLLRMEECHICWTYEMPLLSVTLFTDVALCNAMTRLWAWAEDSLNGLAPARRLFHPYGYVAALENAKVSRASVSIQSSQMNCQLHVCLQSSPQVSGKIGYPRGGSFVNPVWYISPPFSQVYYSHIFPRDLGKMYIVLLF